MNENNVNALLAELTGKAAKAACDAIKDAVNMLSAYGQHLGTGKRENAAMMLAAMGKAQKHLVGYLTE